MPCVVNFKEIDTLPTGLKSAIGHADTARVLGVEPNRINVHLAKGDVAYIAQLMGGRLPEGSTTLPEGFKFKFIRVEVGNTDMNIPIPCAKAEDWQATCLQSFVDRET